MTCVESVQECPQEILVLAAERASNNNNNNMKFPNLTEIYSDTLLTGRNLKTLWKEIHKLWYME